MATLTRTNPTAVARGVIQELTSVSMFKVVLSGANLAVAGSDAAAAKVTDALGGMSHILQTKADGTYLTQSGTINHVDIGAKPGSSNYVGYFDDFRFYKTELDQAKISAVYSYSG